MSDREQLVLVDGSGLYLPGVSCTAADDPPDGTPVNAVYGFTSMLMKLVDDLDPAHMAVFDTARQTFRNDIYAIQGQPIGAARKS